MYQTDSSGLLNGKTQYPVKGFGDVVITPPEATEGHIARWSSSVDRHDPTFGEGDTGSWEVIEDNRKVDLYIEHGQKYEIGSDHDGQSYDGLGPVPDWLSKTEPPAPEPTISELRQAKLDAATDKRWLVMTGGMTLPNDVSVGTTIDDQNRITSVVANAELAGLADSDEVDFKAETGWIRITIAEVKQIAGAIGQFVQACYSAERTHHEAINGLPDDRSAIEAYDVESGWPSGAQA